MRESANEEVAGIVKNGFDYNLQVWVKNYIIQDCGHEVCRCEARQYQGQDIRQVKEIENHWKGGLRC